MEKEENLIIKDLSLKPLPDWKPEEFFDKGMSSLEQENFEEALYFFDEAIKLNPKYIKAWFYKGEAYEKCDEFENAMKCFDEAIRVRNK